jgi:hypothetical protein
MGNESEGSGEEGAIGLTDRSIDRIDLVGLDQLDHLVNGPAGLDLLGQSSWTT